MNLYMIIMHTDDKEAEKLVENGLKWISDDLAGLLNESSKMYLVKTLLNKEDIYDKIMELFPEGKKDNILYIFNLKGTRPLFLRGFGPVDEFLDRNKASLEEDTPNYGGSNLGLDN